ncbi:MAG: hypothetical protein COA41_01645 [Sphingopyxis sp.]|nr:MAG: hypothetical protein COA41_01645 [Sphingopyxis sp.]
MKRLGTIGLTSRDMELGASAAVDLAVLGDSPIYGDFETISQPDVSTGRDTYNLYTALAVIRSMETSATRNAVFAEIKNKNPVYRVVDMLYNKAGSRILQPLVLLAYMFKCVLSLGPFEQDGQDAVSISNFHNEASAIARLMSFLPDAKIMQLSLQRAHLFRPGWLRATLNMVGAARRVLPYLSRLARSYGFMPSARIASGLAFYMRFCQLFTQHPELRAAIVASNYSPEALGLAAAAHATGRNVIYVNHAPVPANGATVPPVLADCAVFYGDAIRKTYVTASRCNADVALIGQPGTTRPMEWRDEIQMIGIFLTALTCSDAVEKLVAAINQSNPTVQILIRNHPVALLKSDFSELTARHKNVKVTIGTPLDDEINACDLIFCGNSGVAMNALRGGRPVAYCDSLDSLNHDYCGFIQDGLVCEVRNWSNDLYPMLKAFYTGPAWRNVMQSYDASYNSDNTMLEEKAARKIQRYLS